MRQVASAAQLIEQLSPWQRKSHREPERQSSEQLLPMHVTSQSAPLAHAMLPLLPVMSSQLVPSQSRLQLAPQLAAHVSPPEHSRLQLLPLSLQLATLVKPPQAAPSGQAHPLVVQLHSSMEQGPVPLSQAARARPKVKATTKPRVFFMSRW